QPLVCRNHWQQDRPHYPRRRLPRRVSSAHRLGLAAWDRGGPGRQPLGHRLYRQQDWSTYRAHKRNTRPGAVAPSRRLCPPAGSRSASVTDVGKPSLTGTATVTVTPAAATGFQVTAPGSTTAGVPFSSTLTAQDAFGNTATSYAGTVHFSSSDGQAVLPANA